LAHGRASHVRGRFEVAMVVKILRLLVVALVLSPAMAAAEPIKLKLSFFTSDRSNIYLQSIKPFVDAVNAEGTGLIEIDTYFSGVISRVQSRQPELVSDDTADMAIVVPGQSPEQFPDSAVMELPGVFRNALEASRIFNRLVKAKAFKGFDDYYVIGTFVSGGESIHSRKPLASLADLNGQSIRTNNRIEAVALEKFGAIPVTLAINQTTDAISRGKIDGATVPPSMLFEFGIGRVTSHHYMIRLGGAPTALIMNRKKFEGLPPRAQAIIRKYSGDWLSDRSAIGFEKMDNQVLAKLKSDPRRTVTFPSPADLATIHKVFASVVEEWAASSRGNRDLLNLVKADIAQLRSSD
jgi:TRAP-type C4-dicarboxylate transport system substrate-binding protein